MREIFLKDKNMILEVPEEMDQKEVLNLINKQFYPEVYKESLKMTPLDTPPIKPLAPYYEPGVTPPAEIPEDPVQQDSNRQGRLRQLLGGLNVQVPEDAAPGFNIPQMPKDTQAPLFEELGLPVGKPGLLLKAIDIPFIPGREIARAPGGFTEADPFSIEQKGASISDLGGQLGRKIFEALHDAPGPKKVTFKEGEMTPGDFGEQLGRLVAEMGVEIPVANTILNVLSGTIGSTAKAIRESETWRRMSIRERQLVVQSLDDVIRNNPELTEGQILKRYSNLQKEAFKAREKPPLTAEQFMEERAASIKRASVKAPVEPPAEKPMPEPTEIKKVEPAKPQEVVESWEKGWSIEHDPLAEMAAIPGEPLEIYKDGKAFLFEDEQDRGYYIKRKDDSFVLNKDAKNEFFEYPEDAKKAFLEQRERPTQIPEKTEVKAGKEPEPTGDYDVEDNRIPNGIEVLKRAGGFDIYKGTTHLGRRMKKEDAIQLAIKQGEKVKPKPTLKVKPKPAKGANIRTMRGFIKNIGGINFLNFKGELRDMPTATKFLSKKSGVPVDDAVTQLIDDGWLDKGTTVAQFLEELRTNPKILSRDRVARDIGEKKEHELTEQEKRLKKEMAWEPEEPPPGDYVTLNAEDLPKGKKLTLIEGKTATGWDVYEVTEKDPFSITLKDGNTIELKPMDKVQVLKEDVAKEPERPTERILRQEAEKKAKHKNAELIDTKGRFVRWDRPKKTERDGLKATYYPIYDKDGTFYSWKTKTEIDRIKKNEGKNILTLGQEGYGRIRAKKIETEQQGLGFVVEDKKQPGLFASVGKYATKKILSDAPFNKGDVETGKPLKFYYLRSKEKAPNLGSEFAQDIEPSGKYVTSASTVKPSKAIAEKFEFGIADLKNPLVLEHKTSRHGGWKTDLSKMYGGKTGKSLSNAIIKDGYDGIVTVDKGRISESVILSQKPAQKQSYTSKTGYASTGEYATNIKSVIDLPEMVELAKELMKGKYPEIRKRLRAAGGLAKGVFWAGGTGKIGLRADLFQDVHQAAATLAHEIGHLVDYLPDNTLKRGNILGHLASLKKYMKHSIPSMPGGLGELTAKDRARLRYQAQKLIGKNPERWIDEVIRKELPIKPEDVLNIWNAVVDAKAILPELYEYIAKLDTAQKKAIVKDAIKGVVRSDLQQFAKVIEERTGKKVKIELSEQELKDLVKEKYAELINDELKKRKLFDLETITKELKSLTHAWKPFDPAADPKFTKYRYKPEELYADAFSALINAPGLLKSHAPNFYEGFFNYLESKPEVERLYNKIQDMILNGTIDENLDRRILNGFRRGDAAYAKALDRDFRLKDGLARDFIDIHWALIKKVKQIGEANIPAGKNPRYKMEELVYSGSDVEWIMSDVFNKMVKPLEKAGLTWDDFGYELLLRRIAKGDRRELANTEGIHPERAEKKLAARNQIRTPAQRTAMNEVVSEFKKLNKAITDKGIEAERWSDDLVKVMEDNSDYATYDVVDYIEKRNGRWISSKIFAQVGTLKEIANPATATIMKHIAVIKAINRQIAAESVADFHKTYFPDEIRQAETKWNGKFHEIKKPDDPREGLIVYLKKGKAKGYYVDRWIADMFDVNPIEGVAIARVLKATIQPFRMAFVELNYGFWMFNILRDFWRASTNLPKASVLKFIPSYLKGIKPAFKSVFGIPDDVVKEMLKDKMLISVADVRGLRPEDAQIERMLKMYHMVPQTWKYKIVKPFGQLFTYFTNIGRGLERTTKVAGKLYLDKKFPEMPTEEKARIVRNQAGSPNFLTLGRLYPIYNNLLMFSNAIKEGYRGDYKAFSRNPAEFMWKKAKYVYLPKLLMYAGSLGLLGFGTKAIFDGMSEYDKTNYICVPLGLTKGGKSVYLRVPMDETGRFMGGILWKILNRDYKKMWTGLFDYMSGQAPTLHPGLDVLFSVVDYASGKNPYDHFRGRYAIPEQVFQAGGKRSHEAFLKWLANKSGSTLVYRFKGDTVDEIKSELEKVLGYPFMSNIAGRFLKVSDQGIRENIREIKNDLRTTRAGELLDTKEAVFKIINGEKITEKELGLILSNPDVANRAELVALSRKYGLVFMQEFMTAQSKEEKAAVLKEFIERQNLLNKSNN